MDIITNNLILRKAKNSDLEKIWNNIWKDEDIASTMLWEVTKTYDEAKKRLIRTLKYQKDNYAYFVCLKNTDEPIGFAGVFELEPNIYEDTGICISKKYQGLGYAKEVLEALKNLVFNDLNGERFLYGCFSINNKSKKVCISQGFKYLKSVPITREYDNKDFIVDYYYFDK